MGGISIKISNRKLTYIDENDFVKKYRSLRKYCPKTHKYLCFEVLNKYNFCKEDGVYKQELPTTDEFKAVYGQIRLVYSVKGETVVIENIEPSTFFIDGYRKDLETYKGMPYRNDKDKFKIDLVMAMKGN